MTYVLWATAIASAVTFVVHTFVGGRFVARPLLADRSLPRASKWLNYYCWHVTTVLIGAMTMAFAWMAFTGLVAALAAVLASIAAANAALSAGVAVRARIHPLRFPSTTLFAAVSALGWASLFVR